MIENFEWMQTKHKKHNMSSIKNDHSKKHESQPDMEEGSPFLNPNNTQGEKTFDRIDEKGRTIDGSILDEASKGITSANWGMVQPE